MIFQFKFIFNAQSQYTVSMMLFEFPAKTGQQHYMMDRFKYANQRNDYWPFSFNLFTFMFFNNLSGHFHITV